MCKPLYTLHAGLSHGFYSIILYPLKWSHGYLGATRGPLFNCHVTDISYCPHTAVESGQATYTLHVSLGAIYY